MKVEMINGNDMIFDALKNYVEKDDENNKEEHEKKRLDPNRFGVKDITGLCLRATYYKKTLPKEDLDKYPLDNSAILKISRGSLYDRLIADYLKDKAQIKFEKETMSGIIIAGVLDGEFEDSVFELKTITDSGLYYIKQRMQPNAWDRLQAMVYAFVRNKRKIEIVYIAPTEIITFKMEFTPLELKEVWDDVVGKSFDVSQAIKTKTPPKQLKKDSWQCKGCRFKELCWGEKNDEN